MVTSITQEDLFIIVWLFSSFFHFFQEIRQYIRNIPRTRITGVPGAYDAQLFCQCPLSSDVPGVQSCVNGSDIVMAWYYWAGTKSGLYAPLSDTPPMEYVTNITVS